MEKRRKFELKRIKGKGDRKLRPCLGPSCNKKILTTPETRICDSCKKLIEKTEDNVLFEVSSSRKF